MSRRFTSSHDLSRALSAEGQRKYLQQGETARFLTAASRMDAESRAFCRLLAFTGCRISEGLALTSERLDVETSRVVFQTLKRRKRAFRAVPVPRVLIQELARLARGRESGAPLWSWCRQTAWRRVRWAMAEAGITGIHATPRGLRHGFGVATVQAHVPLTKTRDWMGHADLQSTAIYVDVVGEEERGFAVRLWKRLPTLN
ncbi:tyrosine-type recombinase/integrase [Brevundimonas sp.]|uniref:tyrosine-type recombinase/integrase n=1 Tax=Brevundimonas sp. TaxID=1871086 RepID=UPI003BAC8662